MTTTAEATTIISEALGAPESSVALTAKHLRGSGHWPTGKRGGGRGAARVRTPHAVNLILALVSGAPLAQASENVARISGLTLQRVEQMWFELFPNRPQNLGLFPMGPTGEWRSIGFRRTSDGQWLNERPGLLGSPEPGPLPENLTISLGALPLVSFGAALAALVEMAVADHHAVLRFVNEFSYDAASGTATLRLDTHKDDSGLSDRVVLHFNRPDNTIRDRRSLLAAEMAGDIRSSRAPLRAVYSLPAEALVVLAEIERGSRDALGPLLDEEDGGKETAPQAVTHGAGQDTSRAGRPDNAVTHSQDSERENKAQRESGRPDDSGQQGVSRSASQPPTIKEVGDVFRNQQTHSAHYASARAAGAG